MVSYSGWYDAPAPVAVASQAASATIGYNRNVPDVGRHGATTLPYSSFSTQEAYVLEAVTDTTYPTSVDIRTGGFSSPYITTASIFDQGLSGVTWADDVAPIVSHWNLGWVATYHPTVLTLPPNATGVEYLGDTYVVGSSPVITGGWRMSLTENGSLSPIAPNYPISAGAVMSKVSSAYYPWNGSESSGSWPGTSFPTQPRLSTAIATIANETVAGGVPWHDISASTSVDTYGNVGVYLAPTFIRDAEPAYSGEGVHVLTRSPGAVGDTFGPLSLSFTVQESQYRFIFDTAGKRYPLRQSQRRF